MAQPDTVAEIGVVSGTGYYDLGIIKSVEKMEVATPWGSTSDSFEVGDVGGKRVAFLPRHGKKHSIPPHKVNYRANMWAFREMGVRAVIGVSSMGSLRREISPPSVQLPSDFVSFTDVPSFHDDVVVHVTPRIDPVVRKALAESSRGAGVGLRPSCVAVMTKGPRFETAAEVKVLSGWGDVVGMTMPSEAALCCELGLPYASIASIDNYATGVEGSTPTLEGVIAGGKANYEKVRSILTGAIARL